MIPQNCVLNVLVSSSLWQCVYRFGHAGSTVEQQLFPVEPSLVLIHQCFGLFQPIKAVIGVGAIKPGDLFKSLVDSTPLLVLTFFGSFPVIFSLFPFFFHSFLSSFCFSISLHSKSSLSCLSHCFCKANKIEESVLCADGLLVGGYCGKYGGGT